MILLAAACVSLGVLSTAQRKRIAALESELRAVHGEATVEVITIEIQNHVELATSRSPFVRPLAMVTPGLLRSIVHRATLKMMRSQLAENGVVADVRSRRVPVQPRTAPVDDDDPPPGDPDL